MILSINEKKVLKMVGMDSIPESQDERDELYDKIEDIMIKQGITNDEINEIGLGCEGLLDKLYEIYKKANPSKEWLESLLTKEELDFLYNQNYELDYEDLFRPICGREIRPIEALIGFLEADYVMKYSDDDDNPINENGVLCKSVIEKLYTFDWVVAIYHN